MNKILYSLTLILTGTCFLLAETERSRHDDILRNMPASLSPELSGTITVSDDGQVTVIDDIGRTHIYKTISLAERAGVVIPKEQNKLAQPRWYEAAKKTDAEGEEEPRVQPLTQKEYKAQVWKNWMRKDMVKVEDALDISLKGAASRAEERAGFLPNSFSYIPVGTFSMGSPAGESGRDDDEDQVDVRIVTCFLLGKTEVTQSQWKSVMGNNPLHFKGDNLPVENVSWSDAIEFCWILTQREREAGRLPKNWKYTLPTEAQWEYACRAGTTTGYYTGDTEADLARAGWYDGNSDRKTHPVGQKEPNAFGLYDMHGNVWEWCSDYYNLSLSGGTDPVRTSSGNGKFGSDRVYRGGSWNGDAQYCRSADRIGNSPGNRYGSLGFRVALVQE